MVSFPFYSNVGLYHSFRFEINLWAYLEGHEGHDPPPFKDIGKLDRFTDLTLVTFMFEYWVANIRKTELSENAVAS